MRLSALFVGLLCFSFAELSVNAQSFVGARGYRQTSLYSPYTLENAKVVGFPRPTMYHSPGYFSPNPGYVVPYGQQHSARPYHPRRQGRQRMNIPFDPVIVPENNNNNYNNPSPVVAPAPTQSGEKKPVQVAPAKPVPPPVDKPIWNENDSSGIDTPDGSIIPSKPSTTPTKAEETPKQRPTEVTVPATPSTKNLDELIPVPVVPTPSANRKPAVTPEVVIPNMPAKPAENPVHFLDSPAVQNVLVEEKSQKEQPVADSLDKEGAKPLGGEDADRGSPANPPSDDFDFGVFDDETPDSTDSEEDKSDTADDWFDFGDVDAETTDLTDSEDSEEDKSNTADDDFDFGDLWTETETDTTDTKSADTQSADDFDFELDSVDTPVAPTPSEEQNQNGTKPIPAGQPADEEEDPFL